MHFPRGTYLPLIKRLKNSTNGVPVAAVGRILEPVQAETLISDGVAELVMLGRTLVTDAAWGLKSLQNRDNDIKMMFRVIIVGVLLIKINLCNVIIIRGLVLRMKSIGFLKSQ